MLPTLPRPSVAWAVVTVDFEASRVAARQAQGVPAERCGRGVADEVALARRESKHRGSRHLGLAKALVRELPHTFAGLRAGKVSEWRASIVCRETALLSADARREVDARLATCIASLEDLQLERAARGLALSWMTSWRCDAPGGRGVIGG